MYLQKCMRSLTDGQQPQVVFTVSSVIATEAAVNIHLICRLRNIKKNHNTHKWTNFSFCHCVETFSEVVLYGMLCVNNFTVCTPACADHAVLCKCTRGKGLFAANVLTVQAEGDVDDSLLCEALQIGDLGTFEVCGGGGVSYVDPADTLLGVDEVHGCGLFGAGGQQAVDRGAAQGGGLDVLGVGNQQDRQPVYWYCSVT